jgi:hypothetical protein
VEGGSEEERGGGLEGEEKVRTNAEFAESAELAEKPRSTARNGCATSKEGGLKPPLHGTQFPDQTS